jgi:hypothetical protein
MSKFIFMLTHHDQTIPNALAVYNEVKDLGLEYIGFKDIGATEEELTKLTESIHRGGQLVALEIVSVSETAEIESAKLGVRLGVDYLLGGRHVGSVSRVLTNTSIEYFPFCGETRGHPTKLVGTVDQIVDDAFRLGEKPEVSGLDLLAYRHNGDCEHLIDRVCSAVKKPVIVAGSIDSFDRLAAVRDSDAWAFTVGSAVFEGRFGSDSVRDQIKGILADSRPKSVERLASGSWI